MVQGIGGPHGPQRPMAGIEDVQTLRTQVGTLEHNITSSATPNWEQAAQQLDTIGDTLAGIQGNNQLHELGGQDLQSILDVAEHVLDKAEKNKEEAGKWSFGEKILRILGYILNIIPAYKTMLDNIQGEKDAAMTEAGKDIPMLEQRVEELRARIDPEKTRMQYFEVRGPSVPLETPDTIELRGNDDQMSESIGRHLLGHQELVRDPTTGRVGGILDPSKVSIKGPDGKELSASEKAAMMRNFEENGGDLNLASSILADGKIDPNEREAIGTDLVNATSGGGTVELKNADGLHGTDVTLRREGADIVASVTRTDAATRSGLQYHRGGEMIPNSDPPRSFQDVISAMNDIGGMTWDPDGTFGELNGLLHQGFVADRESHNISPTMSFQQYKLQFAQIPLEDIAKDDIWWHDGEGDLTAPEWSFLHLRVSDLPSTHIPYYIEFSYKGEDPPRKIDIMLPAESRLAPGDDAVREALEQHLIEKFEVPADQAHRYRDATVINSYKVGREVIGKDTLLPKVEAFGEAQIRMILADSDGEVRNADGSVMDVGENLDAARDLTIKVVNRNVMVSAFRSAAQRSGAAISDLLKNGVPDTQKLFLRQSNGVANADVVDGTVVGQGQVINRGQDVGAFGKCAPTSYFCGAICGVGRGARDALIDLQSLGDPSIAELGTKIEALMTAQPLTEATQQQLTKALDELKAKARTAPTGPVGQAIGKAHASLEQVKTTIVDRMVVKVDDEGPYFEMNFFLPPLGPRGDGYISGNDLKKYRKNAGPMTVKVRPEDVQEYLEWTNRKDEYRGDKRHMMDFFKDPRSLNTAELLGTMGVGLVAVGVDKALKKAGKGSGLLYGPSAKVVGAMVYNRSMGVDTINFDKGADAFKTLNKKLEDSPNSSIKSALADLATLRKDNPVTDGNRQEFLDKVAVIREKRNEVRTKIFETVRASSNDNAKLYVDYIEQHLGDGNPNSLTPLYKDYEHPNLWSTGIPGLKNIIKSDPAFKSIKQDMEWFDTDRQIDTLETRINEQATDVATQKTKVLQSLMSTRESGGAVALTMGFDPNNYHVNYLQSWGTPTIGGVEVDSLDLARSHMNHVEIGAMASAWKNDRAVPLYFTMNAGKIAEGFEGIGNKIKAGGGSEKLIGECQSFVDRANGIQSNYKELQRSGNTASQREEYQEALRDLEADTMDWFQDNLDISNTDDNINSDNVVLMVSNTERDNRLHDDRADRHTVARGNIGDQKRGTSNALDAMYFVPLDMMASGFNNFDPGKARRYAGAEAGDSFALLSSMEVMRPTGGLEVALA